MSNEKITLDAISRHDLHELYIALESRVDKLESDARYERDTALKSQSRHIARREGIKGE